LLKDALFFFFPLELVELALPHDSGEPYFDQGQCPTSFSPREPSREGGRLPFFSGNLFSARRDNSPRVRGYSLFFSFPLSLRHGLFFFFQWSLVACPLLDRPSISFLPPPTPKVPPFAIFSPPFFFFFGVSFSDPGRMFTPYIQCRSPTPMLFENFSVC